ncbi:MAG: hypothetical protein GY790_14545 [Bacteroidetes bacterium]|nr:hypothetical protein [Bacteroidota bacterium]
MSRHDVTRNMITIIAPDLKCRPVGIYDLTGHKLGETELEGVGEARIDLTGYPSGLLLIRAGSRVERVVLVKD